MTTHLPRAGGGSSISGRAKATLNWRGIFTRFAEWLLPPRA